MIAHSLVVQYHSAILVTTSFVPPLYNLICTFILFASIMTINVQLLAPLLVYPHYADSICGTTTAPVPFDPYRVPGHRDRVEITTPDRPFTSKITITPDRHYHNINRQWWSMDDPNNAQRLKRRGEQDDRLSRNLDLGLQSTRSECLIRI